MREQARNQVRRNEQNLDPTREDSVKVFNEDLNGLYRLAFLTGDGEKAEECLVAGIEDCAKENLVFREWIPSWAKRIIVENAIRELKTRPRLPSSSTSTTVFCPSEPSSVSCGHFERFVFVMSVLEHHRHHECALLLGCPVLEIWEGRVHALEAPAGFGQTVSFLS